MGASTILTFASAYPDVVDRAVLLDMIKPVVLPLPWQTQELSESIELFLKMEKKMAKRQTLKSLPLDVLVQRYMEANGGTITEQSVRTLMKRGAVQAADGQGFHYAHDPQVVRRILFIIAHSL